MTLTSTRGGVYVGEYAGRFRDGRRWFYKLKDAVWIGKGLHYSTLILPVRGYSLTKQYL